MSSTLEHRLKIVLAEQEDDGYGQWKRLEKLTGISAARWRNVNNGVQRPATDMYDAIFRLKPQYAFWLATGISDPLHGHTAPGDHGFPMPGEEQPSSSRYFREALAARAAAEAAAEKWLGIELEIEPTSTMGLALADRLLRAVKQLEHAATPELKECLKRVGLAAELRQAEIALQGDMPRLDYDETEAALKAIKRLLTRSLENSAVPDMAAELKGIQGRIARLDEIIIRHRLAEKRLADLKSLPAGEAE